MKVQNQKDERKRKLLLALPVLAFPFLTLMFWSLGGGSGNQVQGQEIKEGFNAELPGANNKEVPLDKMGFYTQAEKDELERSKQLKSDPYYRLEPDSLESFHSAMRESRTEPLGGSNSTFSNRNDNFTEPNEAKVYERLNALQSALNKPAEEKKPTAKAEGARPQTMTGDLDRLEQMMERMNADPATEDPQMKQVNKVLENILDLQHPDRVQQRIKETSRINKGNVYPVSLSQKADPVSMLSANATGNIQKQPSGNGFYGLDNDAESSSQSMNIAIKAVVHETQTLVNGSTIKLRLLDAVYINGQYLPKDQFVFGIANLSGERLNISINSIRNDNMLFPVELSVYDMDGLPGIYIPGAISRDVAKQSGDRSLQGIGLTTMDPSFGAQAASAGIELTKNLVGKKIKLVKVQVKAGYQIMLLDEKQNKNR